MITLRFRARVSDLRLPRHIRSRSRISIGENPMATTPPAPTAPVAALLSPSWSWVYPAQAALASADAAMAALDCCPASCEVCGERLYVLIGATGPYRCGRCQPAYGDPDAAR